MKKVSIFIAVLFIAAFSVIGQTSLVAGDIAFTSYNGDNPDELGFVLLEDIDSSTVISFTDHGWLSTGAFRTNENVIVWTSGQALTKGTIVIINATAPSVGTTTGAMPAFSSSGDQVFAFQGTVTSPTLLAGLNMDGAWASTASNSNSSALPTALIGFVLAIDPEVDNAYYDCVTNGFAGSKSVLFASLIDSLNWITNNALPNVSNCSSFNVVTGTSTLMASVTVDLNVTCNGLNDGGATVVASGGIQPYNYTWSTSDTTATVTGLSAGTYSVVVIDSAGFQISRSVIITEPAAITASFAVTDATIVGGANGSIMTTVMGGTAPYSYNWTGGLVGGTTVSGLSAGNYTVTITDGNGCLLVDSATVSDPAAVIIVMDSSNISCFGLVNGTAKVSGTGGSTPYTYLWSNAVTTDSIGALVAGTYSVTVTDSAGITAVDSVQVTEPLVLQLILTVTNTSAVGTTDGSIDLTVTGGTPSFTYLWSNASTMEDISTLAVGVYKVTVTDGNGCQLIDSAQVLEPGVLANLVITEINYNGPESGLDTSEFIEFTNAGSTTVNLNGYTFPQGITHTFTVNDSITAGQYFVIAFDSAAFRNIYGIDADAVWTTGGLSNGGEDIIIADNFGRGIDTVDFDDNAPWPVNSVTNGPDGNGSSIELQTALTSNNNDGVNWVASALAVPGVTVNGFQVFASPGNLNTTGINTATLTEEGVRVYPNPTEGIITIERANSDLERIQLISIEGKVLNDIQSTKNTSKMDLSNYSNGVYFLRVGDTMQRMVLAR